MATVMATTDKKVQCIFCEKDGIDHEAFWLSNSKIKTMKYCKRRFYLKYIKKLPQGPKVEIMVIGILIHDSFDDLHKKGLREEWFSMSPTEVRQYIYDYCKAYIIDRVKKDKEEFLNIKWGTVFENNTKKLAQFETNRFFAFAKRIPKDKMKYYYLPVLAEEFLKNEEHLYNYIPDGIFRLFETGDPKKDNKLMIFDLKAGSAQPDKVRADDKSQVVSYSIMINNITQNKKKVRLDVKVMKERIDLLNKKLTKLLNEDRQNEQPIRDEIKSEIKYLQEIIKSNERILMIDGEVTEFAILYLGNGKMYNEEIKKVSKTYAMKKIDKARGTIKLHDWSDAWGTTSCYNQYYDKIDKDWKEIICDFHDICAKEKKENMNSQQFEILLDTIILEASQT
jgi:hypothetical protein